MKRNYLTTTLWMAILLTGCQRNDNQATEKQPIKVKVKQYRQVPTDKEKATLAL